jgi:hypothetical protein
MTTPKVTPAMMNLPDLPNLPNLPDLETLGQYARATGALVDLVKKVRDAWPGRKKGAKRDLEKELDALEVNLRQLASALTRFFVSHEKFGRAILEEGPKSVDSLIKLINQFGLVNRLTADLAKIVPDHGRRLRALEQRLEDRGKRVPKKKRRRPKRK